MAGTGGGTKDEKVRHEGSLALVGIRLKEVYAQGCLV